jgi:CRISPR-associated endonuclease Cas2
VQESVFFVEVEEERLAEMMGRVEKWLGAEDRLHVIPVCEGCAGKVVVRGAAWVPREEEFYLV